MHSRLTLSEFIVQKQYECPLATGDLSQLLGAITFAAKIVNREVSRAGLVDITGDVGASNVHGEAQQKLDVFANQVFKQALSARGNVAGLASEEDEDITLFDGQHAVPSKYVVAIDPVDGSSNIDVNIPVGTIFSIYRRLSALGEAVTLHDFAQAGVRQVAAGYVIYGAAAMLVYTTGDGVYGFTYDHSLGTFFLSHELIRFPQHNSIYSVNEGRSADFSAQLQGYLAHCKSSLNLSRKPYNARYVGSMVADFHRNLLKGGIYLYPATETQRQGKLRLLYECHPLAMIAEQAGGLAIDGRGRILDLTVSSLHQRSPFFAGPRAMIEELQNFIFN